MADTETDLCPTRVADQTGYHFHKCGRKVKRDGLCGIHAAQKDRRAEADARWRAKTQEIGERKAAAPLLVERLARHGVAAAISFDGSVSIEDAAAAADALDAKYPASA